MSDHNQLPGTGSIADSVEFVKKLWGIPSAGALPGMLIPTLSLDEINKKIADLKAVESWMAVNMNMLRGTIQALEVQSATIVNLQSMGAMMGAPQPDAKSAAAGGSPASAFPFSFPGWPPAAQVESKPEAAPSSLQPAPAPVPEPAPAAAAPAEPVAPAPVQKAAPAPAAIAPGANAWWDMLQNQFKQAVSTALMPDALKAAVAKPKPVAAKSAASKAKPAARKAPLKATAKKTAARAKAKTPARSARKS
ncbi:MAG TPA: PhaM family polyhydroxyalkanoate granule multifunctional regulatory protein [Herbaspirillum sp.]